MSRPGVKAPRALDEYGIVPDCMPKIRGPQPQLQQHLQIEVPRVRPMEWTDGGSPGPKTPASARRGCRFPSLDEAHRNITGRSHTSTSTMSNRILSNGSSTETDMPTNDCTAISSWPPHSSSNISSTPLHDLSAVEEAALNSEADDTSLSERELVPHRHNNTAVARRDPDDPFVRSQNLSQPLMPKHDDLNSPSTVSGAQSTNTVDRSYYQHRSTVSDQGTSIVSRDVDATLDTTPFCGAPRSSSLDRLSPTNLSALRSGAGARCGFRPDDGLYCPDLSLTNTARLTDEADQRSDGSPAVKESPSWPVMPTSSSNRPLFSLPQVPTLAFFESPTETFARSARDHPLSCGLSFSTLSDSQGLLNGEADNQGGLIPLPLALSTHSRPVEIPRAHLSAGAFSMGATTESDDDPFKYDKGTYGVFLMGKREREVSARLLRQSCSSKQSRSPSCSPSKSLHKKPALPSPIPEHPSSETDGPVKVDRDQLAALQFLNPDAIKSAWEVNQSQGATVKVPVAPRRNASHQPDAATRTNPDRKIDNLQPERHKELLNDRDEWETVGTFQATCDSSPPYPPPKWPHRRGYGADRCAGDVSDENISLYEAQFDECDSTERIIQHPSKEVDKQPFKVRHLKDSNIPVFVPKQRVHRVNGLAQNSIRLCQESPVQGNGSSSAESSRAAKMPNQFGALSKKRRDKLLPPLPRLTTKPCRFEFRDSICSNNHENPFDGEQFGTQKLRGNSRANGTRENYVANQRNSQASTDYDDSIFSAMSSTSHSFAFPLIPLPEAARLQAIRRESGIDDQTFASSQVRALKRTFASLGKNKGSTLITSELPRRPQPVHRRTPTPLFSSAANDTDVVRRARYFNETETSPISSKIDSPPDRRSCGSHLDDNSTATFGVTPLKSCITGIWPSRRSEIPHLYPWDDRRLQPGSDPYLHVLADRDRLPSAHLTYISKEGRTRQRIWFSLMLAVSVFPFLSVLVYLGKFDAALSWYTRGEVSGLTMAQKRTILAIMVLQFFVWTAIVVVVVKKMGGAL